MLSFSFPFLATKVSLPNYYGGDNPLLIYLFFAFIIILIGCSIFFAIHKKVQQQRFLNCLNAAGISGEEASTLKIFMKRLHIPIPLDVITSRAAYGRFIDRVSHYFEHTTLSEEAMMREMQIFDRIRRKLRFIETFRGNKCTNTRALAIDQKIEVTLIDRETKRKVSYTSRIKCNYDFFLGIEPPEDDKLRVMGGKQQPKLEISFDLDEGPHHTFDSQYLRIVNFPEIMWCVQHSSHVRTAEIITELAIPSTVTLPGGEGEDPSSLVEVQGTLVDLSNKEARFCVGSKGCEIESGKGVLLSFGTGEESFSCRGTISDHLVVESADHYRMMLTGLSEEEQKSLLRFVNQEKKKAKATDG